MIRTNKRNMLMLLCLLGCSTWMACKKWVTVPPPVTQVTAAGAFANDQTADATVAGLYSRIMESNLYFLNGALTLYPALSADELYRTSADNTIDPFTANALSAQNTVIATNLWGKAYAYIYQSNACLEGLAAAGNTVSEGTKERLSGELLFMRALCYYYLTRLFGEVPLVLTTDYTLNETLPSAPAAAVFAQVIKDLASAQTKLGASAAVPGATRPDWLAATALLARVYLEEEDWQRAAALADTVINSGICTLETPEAVFLAGSRETIFALSPVPGSVNTAEGLSFIPYSSAVMPTYVLADSLLAAFEQGDLRRQVWVDSAEVNGTRWYYPYKYKVRSSTGIEENNVVLRLAEQYLLRAEARAQGADLGGATADVNTIRLRAGLPPLPDTLSRQALLDAIARENRIEFFAEWGHRWLDLKRLQEADAVLGRLKKDWQATDTLYPVPYSQLQLNPGLTQNPGY